jgi:hypothetical protein
MQLPNPPWYRRWKVILAGVIGLAAITALLGVRGLQGLNPPDTTGQPAATVVTTTTVPPTSTTVAPTTTTRVPGLLWQEEGHDTDKSPAIRADGAWRIDWKFDCSNFTAGTGNFKITGDSDFEHVEIQKDGERGSGSTRFTRGGFGHLFVSSVCDYWSVTVVDA